MFGVHARAGAGGGGIEGVISPEGSGSITASLSISHTQSLRFTTMTTDLVMIQMVYPIVCIVFSSVHSVRLQ